MGHSDPTLIAVLMLWLGLSSGVVLGQAHVVAHEMAHWLVGWSLWPRARPRIVLLGTLRSPTAGGYTYFEPRAPSRRTDDLLLAATALAGPLLTLTILGAATYVAVSSELFTGPATPTRFLASGVFVGDGLWRLYGNFAHDNGDRAIVQTSWRRYRQTD